MTPKEQAQEILMKYKSSISDFATNVPPERLIEFQKDTVQKNV